MEYTLDVHLGILFFMIYKKLGIFISVIMSSLFLILIIIGFYLYSYLLNIKFIQDRLIAFVIVIILQIVMLLFIPASIVSTYKEYQMLKK